MSSEPEQKIDELRARVQQLAAIVDGLDESLRSLLADFNRSQIEQNREDVRLDTGMNVLKEATFEIRRDLREAETRLIRLEERLVQMTDQAKPSADRFEPESAPEGFIARLDSRTKIILALIGIISTALSIVLPIVLDSNDKPKKPEAPQDAPTGPPPTSVPWF